jgi:hypothetical protein
MPSPLCPGFALCREPLRRGCRHMTKDAMKDSNTRPFLHVGRRHPKARRYGAPLRTALRIKGLR